VSEDYCPNCSLPQDICACTHPRRARAAQGGSGLIKRAAVLIVAVIAPVMLGAAGCGDITPGGACDQEGSVHENSTGYRYKCQQVPGGNRIWQQVEPLTPDRP
jgi:hypothetical protein